MVKQKSDIAPLQGIFFLTSLLLVFLWINNPLGAIKEISQVGIFFLVSAALFFIIALKVPALESLLVPNFRDFFAEFSVGMIFALPTIVLEVLTLGFSVGVVNLIGNISPLTLLKLDPMSILVVTELMPLLESVILVGGTMVLYSFLKEILPLAKIISGAAIAVLFGLFHFNVVALQTGSLWEYSFGGFLSFILSPQGALPHVLVGGLWIFLFIIFDSFVLIYSVHRLTNLLSISSTVGWGNEVIIGTWMINIGIFVMTYFLIRKTFNEKLQDVQLKRLIM